MSLISNLSYFEIYNLIETKLPTNTTNLIKAVNTREVTRTLLDTIFQLAPVRVIEIGINTPPVSPTVGDAYIIGSSPTGTWASSAQKLAIYKTDLTWGYIDPIDRFSVLLIGTPDVTYYFQGSYPSGTWVAGASGVGDTFATNVQMVLPSGLSFGKYQNGAIAPWAGLTPKQAILDAVIGYLAPLFSAFSANGQATLQEIGVALSGNQLFQWTISNITNTSPDLVTIKQGATTLGTAPATVGSTQINLGLTSTTTTFTIEALSIQNALFTKTFTITKIYPIFHGKVQVAGAGGTNRPIANQALLNSGTKSVASSTGSIVVDFDSAVDEYVWIAYPASSPNKTSWFITQLNQGNIGTPQDFLGAIDQVVVNSPTGLWAGVNYKFIIANYQSAVTDSISFNN